MKNKKNELNVGFRGTTVKGKNYIELFKMVRLIMKKKGFKTKAACYRYCIETTYNHTFGEET